MRMGSVSAWLATMVPGEYRYVEVDYARSADMMRKLNPGATKRPPELRDYRFKTSLHTSVAATHPTDVRHLIKVERVE